MKMIYSKDRDLSISETEIIEAGKIDPSPSDPSPSNSFIDCYNTIYKNLDPLESALVFLARNINKDLRADSQRENYLITEGSFMAEYELGTYEIYDTVLEIKRLKDNKITITYGKENDRKKITCNLDDFLNKTRELESATSNHQKIHQSVLKINPQLDAFISFSQPLKDIDYVYTNFIFRSYLNPIDHESKNTLYSAKTILEIGPDNTFQFKHIPERLTFEEFSQEVERMKKISELTKTAEDLSKNVFTDCKIRREPNHSNLLLPIVIITKDQDSYVIKNGSVTIKISGNETVKSLEEFVSDLKKDIPLTSSEKPNSERVDGAGQLTK